MASTQNPIIPLPKSTMPKRDNRPSSPNTALAAKKETNALTKRASDIQPYVFPIKEERSCAESWTPELNPTIFTSKMISEISGNTPVPGTANDSRVRDNKKEARAAIIVRDIKL